MGFEGAACVTVLRLLVSDRVSSGLAKIAAHDKRRSAFALAGHIIPCPFPNLAEPQPVIQRKRGGVLRIHLQK